jgi:hypothetical protein
MRGSAPFWTSARRAGSERGLSYKVFVMAGDAVSCNLASQRILGVAEGSAAVMILPGSPGWPVRTAVRPAMTGVFD